MLLVTLPLMSLIFYFIVAKVLFEKDKISYVYDSTSSYSSSKATQIRGTLKILFKTSSFLMSDFDYKNINFSSRHLTFKPVNGISWAALKRPVLKILLLPGHRMRKLLWLLGIRLSVSARYWWTGTFMRLPAGTVHGITP